MGKKLPWIVWFGSVFTKVFYTFICFAHKPFEGSVDTPIILVISILASISFFMAIALSLQKTHELAFVQKIIKAWIQSDSSEFGFLCIRLGFVEAIMVFGMVLYFMTHNFILYTVFLVLCLIAWFANKPKNIGLE